MPNDDERDSRDPQFIPGEIDAGLEFASGPRPGPGPAGPASVVDHIDHLTGRRPRVALRDVEPAGQTPMLKPLVSGRANAAGKYVVQGELGHGGVGAVHKGHDQELGRDVAMKFLHDRYKDEPAILHRFVEEAQIGGQLQHPGIVPVYDLGMVDGKPFFTMKLVKGQTLAKRLAERGAPGDDRHAFLSIFEDVCQTMAYAHARGVVHRDLKPANIMIGSFGEVQIVDWGMGKVLQQGGVADEELAAVRRSHLSIIETVRSSGDGTQSVMGSVMGTPAYMPPEQARGEVDHMDERSDVFALGAILCEILTGLPPYVGLPEDLIAMAAMAKLDDARARIRACGADRDLVELTEQCLLPAPAARPKSAAVVAKAIQLHLAAADARVHEARVEAAAAEERAAGLKRAQTLGISLTAVIAAALVASLWLWRAADAAAASEKLASEAATAAAEDARLSADRATTELARAVAIKSLIAGMFVSIDPVEARGADTALLGRLLDEAGRQLDSGAVSGDFVVVELRSIIGDVYRRIGRYEPAERHLRAAYDLAQQTLEEEHPLRNEVIGELGLLEHDLRRFDAAEPLLRRAAEYRERRDGAGSRAALLAQFNVALVEYGRGRYAEAERLMTETLAGLRKVASAEDRDVLSCRFALANAIISQWRYTDAEPLLRETLAIQKRVLGDDHPHTILSRCALADCLLQLQRIPEAEALIVAGIAACERAFDTDHPIRLQALGGLADLRHWQHQYAEAETLYRDLMPRLRAVFGVGHPTFQRFADALANVLLSQERYDEAEPMLVEVVSRVRERLGPEHPQTLAAISNLGNLYNYMGRFADGAALFEQSLPVKRRVLGESHVHTLTAMLGLANSTFSLGRLEEAEQLYREALPRCERADGDDGLTTQPLRTQLGKLLNATGRSAEAVRLLEQSLPRSRRLFGDGHHFTVTALAELGTAYGNLGRLGEAEPLLREVLELRLRTRGADDKLALGARTNLGHLLYRMGRYAEAAELFKYSLPRKRELLGSDDPWTVSAALGLGISYMALGRPEDARPLYVEVRTTRERTLGLEDWFTLSSISDLGYFYNEVGEHEAAAAELEICLPVMRRVMPPGHPWMRNAIGGLARAYEGLGRTDDAAPLVREFFDYRIEDGERQGTADGLNGAARTLLTHPLEAQRDANRALALARRACQLAEVAGGAQLGACLDTLALALFRTGDVHAAVKTQKRVLDLAPPGAQGPAARLAEYEAALKR